MSDITVTTTEGGVTVVTDTLGAATAAAAAASSASAAATSASNASTSASNAASSASAASTSASTATTQAGNASTSASAASSSASAAAGSASAASTSASNAATSASAASTSAGNAATSASEAAASAAFLNPAAVAITGGTINGTAIGGTTPAAGAFTTLSATGVITNSAATGQLNFSGATYGQVSAVGDLYLDAGTAKYVYVRANGGTVGQFTAAGLAVTGALGATGNITSTAGQIISQGATAALVAFPRDGSGSEFSLYNPTGDALHVYGSSADIATFSSTGLAVTGVLTLNETVPAGITLNVFNASETGTTMGGNTLLRLASNASGADSTIQFTDSVANNAYISGKSGHIYIQPTTAGISVADFSSTALSPGADNTYNLGSASLGWKELFCDNGTINTSDARRKTEVSALSAAEINAAKQLAKEIGSFKFLAAVAEKGDAARNHIGMTVQRSIAIMEANGLNPFAYSFICHDAWDDEFAQEQTNVGQKVVKTRRVERQMVAERTESVTAIEMRDGMPTLVTKEIVKTDPVFHDILVCGEDGRAVMVVDQPATDAVLDDAGVEIEPARAATFKPLTHPVPTMEWVTESYEEDAPPTYVTVKVRDAGDKYSFRVHELLLFIAAGLEARMSALEVA